MFKDCGIYFLLFSFPIAFSTLSISVLCYFIFFKYSFEIIDFGFTFILLKAFTYVLYSNIFVCAGFFSFFKCNLDLVLEEFSRPIVIQGSRLIFLDLILTVFIGKDLSNAFL